MLLTVSVSSGSCMVMQSMLIWMVFPADPSVGLSVKFSSMGWTEWMADLKHKRRVILKNSWYAHFLWVTKVCVCFCIHSTIFFFLFIHLLVQYIKQLVEYILAEGVSCLCWLILRHGGEEWALSPGQTRRRVPESARRQNQPRSHSFYYSYSKLAILTLLLAFFFFF